MRAVYILVAWLAWLGCGVFAFGLPQLVSQNGSALTALEAASPQVKIYVALWVIGSVILFALLLSAVHGALVVKPKPNKPLQPIAPKDGAPVER